MNKLIQKAVDFATKAHEGQTRKNTFEPYITHPIAVAKILEQHADPSVEMVCAAILHDTIEDCGVTPDEIENEFGYEIRCYVEDLTDDKSIQGPRAVRKAAHVARLANVRAESQTIKCCDIYHNTKDIEQFNDPKFEKLFLTEKKTSLDVLKKADRRVRTLAYNNINSKLKRSHK